MRTKPNRWRSGGELTDKYIYAPMRGGTRSHPRKCYTWCVHYRGIVANPARMVMISSNAGPDAGHLIVLTDNVPARRPIRAKYRRRLSVPKVGVETRTKGGLSLDYSWTDLLLLRLIYLFF